MVWAVLFGLLAAAGKCSFRLGRWRTAAQQQSGETERTGISTVTASMLALLAFTLLARTNALQTEMWRLTTDLARRTPTPITAALVAALSEMLFGASLAQRFALRGQSRAANLDRARFWFQRTLMPERLSRSFWRADEECGGPSASEATADVVHT